jgi:hypothetical protein
VSASANLASRKGGRKTILKMNKRVSGDYAPLFPMRLTDEENSTFFHAHSNSPLLRTLNSHGSPKTLPTMKNK